jgi:hypothetical protein
MLRMHVATTKNLPPHTSLCRAQGQLCLQQGLQLFWDTSFDVQVGSKHSVNCHYAGVWCVPSATHVHYAHQSQNKVLDTTKFCYFVFLTPLLSVIPQYKQELCLVFQRRAQITNTKIQQSVFFANMHHSHTHAHDKGILQTFKKLINVSKSKFKKLSALNLFFSGVMLPVSILWSFFQPCE